MSLVDTFGPEGVDPRVVKVTYGGKLRYVYVEAGKPPYRTLVRRGFPYSPATITRALRGETFPK